jgi:peptidoglycan/LPS O-acetylase OafA/YrhL
VNDPVGLPPSDPSTHVVPSRRKIEGIEILRFLLAFGVMIYHYAYFGPITGRVPGVAPGPEWLVSGRFGVSAFFIISGFVIIYSAGNRGAGAFALARFARLAPALLVCATVTMAVLWAWPGIQPRPSIGTWAKNASTLGLLLGDPYVDGSYWSITIELRFYLYVFLLLLLLKDIGRIRLIAMAWMAASYLAMAFYHVTPLRILTLSPHSAFFILGIVFYCWLILGDRRFMLMMLAPGLVLAGWQGFVDFQHVDVLAGGGSPWWIAILIAVIPFVLVRAFAFGIESRRWSGLAREAGAVSYPLYLLHQSLGYRLVAGMVAGGLTPVAAIAITAIGMVAAAWALSRTVEPAGRAFLMHTFGKPGGRGPVIGATAR